MADDHTNDGDFAAVSDGTSTRRSAVADAPAGASGLPPDWSAWSNLWQIPVIVVSLAAISLGLWTAMGRAPENDFDGALAEVESLIGSGRFETAQIQLNEVIAPHLTLATQAQRARFNAAVAEWIVLAQSQESTIDKENSRNASEYYREAVSLGHQLDAAQLERWAQALIDIGNLDDARRRLNDLDAAVGLSPNAQEIRSRRNRVLRRIVEETLTHESATPEHLMTLLDEYRNDPILSPVDELWAIARVAETRVESDHPQEAIDHLLLDMRRLEPRLSADPELNLGELYTLLARAYYDLGNYRYAEFNAQQALDLFAPGNPLRAAANVLLGQVAISDGRWRDALELFDGVAKNDSVTPVGLTALLGRAEVNSVLGKHEHSLADYMSIRDRLTRRRATRDVTPKRVARSLADRHDAALAMSHLPEALLYITLAESFFDDGELPADLALRIASTSRQLADNLITDAKAELADTEQRPENITMDRLDPEVRTIAADHHKRAADYFVQHARAMAGQVDESESWARSLWLAADSYDLAGWPELAIEHFAEYVAGRSENDPQRVEAKYRLAEAHHAAMDYLAAADLYQQVIDEHPTSHVASRSYLPLARCLKTLDRRPQAIQLLLEVVRGERNLRPDAIDFRDALVELGTSYYETERFIEAIEYLDEAMRRYPTDPALDGIRFRLADSYRRHAEEVQQQLEDPITAPAQRRQLESLRTQHLRTAMGLFEQVGTAKGTPERLMMQYAGLYQADCAYELGDYQRAVGLYDQVAGRFPREVASLEALIQIVVCYSAIDDSSRARHAHQRALTRLHELPDAAFDSPDVPFDRDKWEKWLQTMPVATGSIQ